MGIVQSFLLSKTVQYSIDTCVLQCVSSCNEYSHNIAKTMCCFMGLAYETPDSVSKSLINTESNILLIADGLRVVHFPNLDLCILTFAGMRMKVFSDWWTILTGNYKSEWNNLKNSVSDVLQTIPTSKKIFCGHSKGGITAILAFCEFKERSTELNGASSCYVAGVPDYFWNKENVDGIGIYNIIDVQDPIANVTIVPYKNKVSSPNSVSTSPDHVIIGKKGGLYSISKHTILSYIKSFECAT